VKDTPGTYPIDVNGFAGSFIVKEKTSQPETPPTPSPIVAGISLPDKSGREEAFKVVIPQDSTLTASSPSVASESFSPTVSSSPTESSRLPFAIAIITGLLVTMALVFWLIKKVS